MSLLVANKFAVNADEADTYYFLFNRINNLTYQVKFEKHDLTKNKTRKIGLVLGSLTDINEAFVLSNFVKYLGFGDIQFENYKMALNLDAPYFYSLNTSINSFENTNCLFVVGSNLRYEASILNTMIRKYQMRRNFQIINVGAYSDLRLKQNHYGNGLRSLINIIQNRSSVSLDLINMKNVSLILGAESLKNRNSFFLQNLLRLLAKKLFLTTKKTTRFGILHSSVGSLSTAFLGVSPNVRSALNVTEQTDKGLKLLLISKVKEFKNAK
jgi:NADH-quinone oxidoreductase subunit G